MFDAHDEGVPPDCVNVVLHVWDYLDGRMPPEATLVFAAHLAHCGRCDRYRRFQQRFLDALSLLRTRRGAPWSVKGRVLASLSDAGYAPR